MMTEPTIEKMHALRLYAMTSAWIAQRADSSVGELHFDERLGLLVEAETLSRDNKRLAKLLREAKLRIPTACMEDVDLSPKREIDKPLFRQLATGRWLADRQNVIATGMTGVGKSYFACALGQLSCRLGFRVSYKRVPRLFEELALAHADGTYVRLLARLAKVDVLILDDWALAPLNDQQRRDVLEILEDRHGARSTVVTSQLPIENWHDYIAHPTIADAVLDRLVHNAHKLKMKGPRAERRMLKPASDLIKPSPRSDRWSPWRSRWSRYSDPSGHDERYAQLAPIALSAAPIAVQIFAGAACTR